MTTDITKLSQRMKAAAEKATPGPWGVARDGKTLVSNQSHPIATVSDAMHRMLADGSTGKDAEFIALANPANIRALVEALEKAQAKNALVAGGIEAAENLHDQIASLKYENAALKGNVENAAGCINAAYAEGLIDVLAESSDERLVDLVKRRLLHAYLPVETPATNDVLVAMGDAVLLEQLEDGGKAIISQSNIIGLQANRIAELESSHTKLRESMAAIHNTIRMDGAYNPLAAILNAAKRAHEESASAAGIKWEAE
ncbi:ead/Ea22-like family protein [Raoultella ornithinolytica]|uniref:ead/Ea22-like family protein n=1 Tax=Raoultella ornithinolytica TaxID=54291 RepID=UPI00273FC09A|nr:ead/Ea22-like family protein [Raoultella ornithinolytica]WLP44724.1 ead/Ea22-like family protein [Raoultella ornithinolytica]